jgi:two-component system OmpR family sensor kinase
MQRLVEDIMVLAKSRRPDFVHPEEVVVSDLLAVVADKIAPLGVRNWTIDASTDATAQLDQQRITQALVQLVANALRFTEPGSVIALGARTDAADLRLWVRDEGVGISAEDQQRIFERFGRGEQVIPGLDEGAGLGLAIVTAIAEAHHGRVTLDSTVGMGSTFTLVLPLHRDAGEPVITSTDSAAGSTPAHPDAAQADSDASSRKPHDYPSEDRQWQPS